MIKHTVNWARALTCYLGYKGSDLGVSNVYDISDARHAPYDGLSRSRLAPLKRFREVIGSNNVKKVKTKGTWYPSNIPGEFKFLDTFVWKKIPKVRVVSPMFMSWVNYAEVA